MSKQRMNPKALDVLIQMSDEARNEYLGAVEDQNAASRKCDMEAVAVADWVLAGIAPTPGMMAPYKRAKISAEFARNFASEKYNRYSQISDQLLQEMQKPPAVAPAEGDETKTNQ